MPDELMDLLESTISGDEGTSKNPEDLQPDKKEAVDYKERSRFFYGKLKEEREARKKVEGELAARDALVKKEPQTKAPDYMDLEEIVDLRVSGHSKEEVDFLRNYAKGVGKPLSEVAKDSMVSVALEAIRSKAKGDQATPPPSTRAPSVEQKSFASLPEDDKKRAWVSALDKAKSQNSGQRSYQ